MADRDLASASDQEELRERGVVPYSVFATRCAGGIAALVCIAVLWGAWGDSLELTKKFMSYSGPLSWASCQPCQDLRQRGFGLVIVIPVAVFLVSLAIGLFQTRFLFYWGNLGFDVSRLNQTKMFSLDAMASRVAKALLIGAVLVAAWLAVIYKSIGSMAGLLNGNKAHFIAWLPLSGKAVLPIAAFVLALVGFLTWIGARIAFLYKHRSSRSGTTRDLYQDD